MINSRILRFSKLFDPGRISKRFCFVTIKRPNLSELRMPSKEEKPKLMDIIRQKIKLSGPLTIADYMNIVSANPLAGYYTKKEVIGVDGDFITSPEISQLFCEMLAIWFCSETQKMCFPDPLQIVELGPGKGTLVSDILRIANRFGYKYQNISVHLVEVSETMMKLQAHRLCLSPQPAAKGPHIYEGETVSGAKVYWYQDLSQVPHGFSWFIAHEFFDALPIHKFQKTAEGWREVLIDLEGSGQLAYRLSAEESKASRLLVRPPLDGRDAVEVSPRALAVAHQLAARVDADGGLALVVDYGHSGEKRDTFRAFRKHALVEPLSEPGSADLTADVDFSQLRAAASQLGGAAAAGQQRHAIVAGPVTQRLFLQRLLAETRLKRLVDAAQSEEEKKNLKASYEFLTDADKMGERFKFMAFYPSSMAEILNEYPPLGFTSAQERTQ